MGRNLLVAVGIFLMFACQDSVDPGATLSVRVLSGGGTDTIDVFDTIVVQVNKAPGFPAPGQEILFHAVSFDGDSVYPTSFYLVKPGCFCGTLIVPDTTDNAGRASVIIVHGPRDGEGLVVITAAMAAGADTVRVTTTPGTTFGTQVSPRDRPIVVGGSYVLGARQVDRHGNTVPSSVTFTPTSGVVDVSTAGVVHGNVIGRARIHIQLGSWTDSAFTSVVPSATLALRDYDGYVGDSSGYAQMNLDGSDFHWLFKTDILGSSYSPSNFLAPQWIPGTGQLVHLRLVSGVTRLFVGDSSGTTRRLIDNPGPMTGESDPQVSGDGSWVYFVGHSATGDAIWRVAIGGVVPERLTPESSYADMQYPSPSPDGSRLAYIKWNRAYLLNLSTGDTTQLSANQAAGTLWSPTGDWILYAASYPHTGYSGPLHLIHPDGTEDHVLSSDAYFPGGSWSPDGTYLIVSRAVIPYHQELINVTTGERLPLVYERTWYGPAWRH